jgi:hypothetical protein
VRGGLIGEQHPRAGHERRREQHLLLAPGRERRWIPGKVRLEVELAGTARHFPHHELLRQAQIARGERQLFGDRGLEDLAAGILKDRRRDHLRRRALRRPERQSVQRQRSRRDRPQPRKRQQQAGLPPAILPHQHHPLARPNRERDPLNNRLRSPRRHNRDSGASDGAQWGRGHGGKPRR